MIKQISKEKAEMLFREHSAYIYRTALFLTRDKALADDITQEAFLQIFSKYGMYDASKPIKPWIYKITLNITRNMLRKQKWCNLFGETPENGCGEWVETAVIKSEEEAELWLETNKLSLKSREVIILHFYSGLKLKEISEILDIPLGTCKSRLNQALNTLRKQLPENDFHILSRGGDIYETI